jgi:hypothetical protein
MIKRPQNRASGGSQVRRPLSISGWLNVTSSANAQLPDSRQVDRFTIDATNAAISLNYHFHDVLPSARTTQNVAAWPIDQQAIQNALHFSEFVRDRLSKHIVVAQLLRVTSLNDLLCSLDQRV